MRIPSRLSRLDLRAWVSDAFSAADVFLIPQILSAKRLGVDVAKFPRVSAAFASTADLPFVMSAAPEAQPDAPR